VEAEEVPTKPILAVMLPVGVVLADILKELF
jgi:hypothetical protein